MTSFFKTVDRLLKETNEAFLFNEILKCITSTTIEEISAYHGEDNTELIKELKKVDWVENRSYFFKIKSIRAKQEIIQLSFSSNLDWISIENLETLFTGTLTIKSDYRADASLIELETIFSSFKIVRVYCSGILENKNNYWTINNKAVSKKKLLFGEIIFKKQVS